MYGLGYAHGNYYSRGYDYYPYYSGTYYAYPAYGTTTYVEPSVVYDLPAEDAAAEPILPEAAPAVAADGDGDKSEQFLVAAEDAFRAGEYQEARRHIQHALIELPGDGRAMLFLAQTLLATGDYQQAVGATYQGMSLLDEKDWGFVVANYDKYYGNDDYVAQTKALGDYIKKNPKAAYAYALRGYHWGYLGYPESARKDLAKAVELEPRDTMAAKLLTKFGGTAPEVKPPAKAPVVEKPPTDLPLPPPPVGEPPLKLKGR